MTTTLLAGAARRTIDPPLGTRKVGQRLYGDPIQAIRSHLTGTCCVLANGETKVAILALDLCEMLPSEALAIRAAVGRAIGTPATHVLLNMAHNHSCPALPGHRIDPADELALKDRYRDDLTRWIVEAAVEADRSLRPARIGSGWGHSDIGVYRRETDRDGRDVLGEVPGHPIDRSVGVVRVDDLDGQAIAVLFSVACHVVVVGPRSMVATPDFPGPARAVLEDALGGMALFMQACGANINPAVGIGWEIDGRDEEHRVGAMLGAEALKVAAGIRTDRVPGERRAWGTIPNILFRPLEPVTGPSCWSLGAVEETIRLEYGQLPSIEDANRIHRRWQETLAERETSGAVEWELRVARTFEAWSSRLVAAVRDGRPQHEVVIQVLRVNDIVLAGISMEAFFETGMTIKARSPVAHTQVLGYTNGSTGYLPRAVDYPSGGWQLDGEYHVPDLYVQSYMHPVALHPDSEQMVVDKALDLIGRLA